jgi:hypothetical protein
MHDIHGVKQSALEHSGWLGSDTPSRDPILWLPLERRIGKVASRERRVVVGGPTGVVTILELPGKQDHPLFNTRVR